MHELSIALSILDIAVETCGREGWDRVDTVRVKIGTASGVMTDALLFAWESARGGTPASKAELEIEVVPVGGSCRDCGEEFTVQEKYVILCPKCGGSEFTITSGRELHVTDLEVDD